MSESWLQRYPHRLHPAELSVIRVNAWGGCPWPEKLVKRLMGHVDALEAQIETDPDAVRQAASRVVQAYQNYRSYQDYSMEKYQQLTRALGELEKVMQMEPGRVPQPMPAGTSDET